MCKINGHEVNSLQEFLQELLPRWVPEAGTTAAARVLPTGRLSMG